MTEYNVEKIIKDITDVDHQIEVMQWDNNKKLRSTTTALGDLAGYVNGALNRAYLSGMRDVLEIIIAIAHGEFTGNIVYLPSGKIEVLNVPKGKERMVKPEDEVNVGRNEELAFLTDPDKYADNIVKLLKPKEIK